MSPSISDSKTPISGDILIVDDTPSNLRLLSDMLVERGYKVRMAPNGKLALMGVQAVLPDLILLDIKMAGLSGYDVCKQLKAESRTRDIPVIFISAQDQTGDKIKAFTYGGVDYITKPFQVEVVLARIANHLTICNLQKKLQGINVQLEDKNKQLQEKNAQLQEAFDNIKTLKGFIPICANCKKIRDDEGFWENVEIYVRDHTEAEFSHSICPDCMQELYPEFYEEIDECRKNIVEVLKKLGQARLEEIVAAVNFPEGNMLNCLESLVEDGQVKCLKVGEENHYILL